MGWRTIVAAFARIRPPLTPELCRVRRPLCNRQADEGPGETAGGVSVTVVKRATCSREAAVRKGSYIVLDWEGTQASGVSLGAGSGEMLALDLNGSRSSSG